MFFVSRLSHRVPPHRVGGSPDWPVCVDDALEKAVEVAAHGRTRNSFLALPDHIIVCPEFTTLSVLIGKEGSLSDV